MLNEIMVELVTVLNFAPHISDNSRNEEAVRVENFPVVSEPERDVECRGLVERRGE